jgi:hypothetical protein
MENTQNTCLEILRLILKVLKFSTYLAITLLELFIKVSKALLNLTDYEPFKFVKDYKYEVLGKRVENDINLQTIQVATNNMARHQYNFPRSEMFQTQYKNIQEILKICKDEQAPINDDIYKDILYRIGILIVESEKVALKEGHQYAKRTKFLLDNKIYDNYVREKILSGEADGLMQEYLYNQRKADNGNERGFTIDDY